MYEIWTQALEHAQGMWRYRWWALAVAWLVALSGWAWVYSLPNVYEASARVYVDTESSLRPLLRGLAIETDVMSQVQLMTRVLLSRPQLERVAREADLDLTAETPKQLERVVETLRSKTTISSDRINIYTIRYLDADRGLAQRVVKLLLDKFVENSLVANRSDTENTQRFLDEQIREHEKRLTEAEQRLAEFKKEHVGLMPGSGGGYYERLQAAIEQLESLRSQLRLAQDQREYLRGQVDGESGVEPAVPGSSAIGFVDPLADKIAQYERNLSDLRLRFTDKHPDIIALEETLERLRAEQVAQRSSLDPATGGRGNGAGPVYQELRIALTNVELELTTLRGKIAAQDRRVSELKQAVDTIPEIEAELTRLNRDYDVTKSRYEQLLQRRESARLGEQADEKSQDVKFKILEPALASSEPVAPNRPLYLTAVLFAAMGAAGALALLLHQLKPVFNTRRALAHATGCPVLGAVSLVENWQQRRRRYLGTGLFAGSVVALLLAYGATVMLQGPGVRIARALIEGQGL